MNKLRVLSCFLLAIALGTLAAAAFADGPAVSVGDRWANAENARPSDAGETVYRCATDQPRGRPVAVPDMAQVERWIQENRISAGGVIPVNFHVITSPSGEGAVSDAVLDAQIAVLNNNFAGKDYNGNPVPGAANTGYTFFRNSVTRNANNKWFKMTPGNAAERQAKNALAVNWTSTLNLYTCKPGQNLLGWATFPVDLAANGKMDGVVIHYGSLPGGYLSPYNLGGTATHEVGHWVGLYHTFQGGCGTASCGTTGDLICDTPAEATPTSGCPSGKDTCPAAGLDPIHNYMDYSTDACYDNFTPGQDARADVQMSTYRPLIGSARFAIGGDNKLPPQANGLQRCATGRPTDKPVDVPDMATVDRWIQENRIAAGGVIPVNFHVIYSGATGNVPESQLDAQIAVLNNNFAGKDYNGNVVPGAKNTGYTFFKASVSRTNNASWFAMSPGSSAERSAKRSLSVDYSSSLNLYTANPGGGLLGWATFPSDLRRNKAQDGVVIHYGSLPGGFLVPFDLGGTATHEVGHWVGLYHTFQGGCHSDATCSTAGDLVCDTPAEGTATSGCPAGKNTCAGAGNDPIHNYMDYSDDDCYDNFTAGQDARADVMMSTYRPLIGSARVAGGAGAVQSARELNGGLVAFRATPNPFNPRTKIEFGMRSAGHASVRIFDVRGRLVRTLVDRDLEAGNHSVDFDGNGLASGVYLMKLSIRGEAAEIRRITLMK